MSDESKVELGAANGADEAPGYAPFTWTEAAESYYQGLCAHKPGVRIAMLAGKGKAGFATMAFSARDVVFTEMPLASIQHLENVPCVQACARCHRFVGTLQSQLRHLACIQVDDTPAGDGAADTSGGAGAGTGAGAAGGGAGAGGAGAGGAGAGGAGGAVGNTGAGESTKGAGTATADAATLLSDKSPLPFVDESAAELSPIIPCSTGCGLMYCSEACLLEDKAAHHSKLCPGVEVPDAPLGSSPWRIYEMQAAATNDILLVGAKVFANVVARWEANGHDLKGAMMPYTVFHARPWWEVIALEDDSATPEEIEAGLREVLDDALTILRAMLWQEGLDALFQADFFASLIGAFELNNLTVEIASPVRECMALLELRPANAGGSVIMPVLDAVRAAKAAREAACDSDSDDEADAGHDNPFNPDLFPEMEGTALFAVLCCLNHSCEPNIGVSYMGGTTRVHVVALRDIEEGEELCFSYVDEDLPYAERTFQLRHYGFVCTCPKCEREKAEASSSKK